MKRILFLLFINFGFLGVQGQGISDLYEIQEAELKSNQAFANRMPNNHNGRDAQNSNYDVTHYTVDLTINNTLKTFTGFVEVTFTAKEDLNTLEIDAQDNLSINSVEYNGMPLTNYLHAGNILTVNFPTTITENASEAFTVFYSGNEATSPGYRLGVHGPNDTPIAYTLSEPFDASSWWICKDDLVDKSDNGLDIYITHPTEYSVGSNGLLQSNTDLGDGTTRTHWKHTYPIVSYLFALGITDYVTYNSSVNLDGVNLPIENYLYPESNTAAVQNQLNQFPAWMQFYHNLLGEYPYINEKYGHMMWNLNGGMEHATMSSMVNFGRTLSLHELAHQWYGDQVTCATWSDIWINEGFAVYLEGVLVEDMYNSTWWDWKNNHINNITSSPSGSVYVPPSEAVTLGRIFSGRLSYSKGAMLLHMLRFKVGDTAFFQALRNFLVDAEHNYGFATSQDFIDEIESVSGMDLSEFFADWLYGQGHPVYDIDVSQNAAMELTIQAEQTPSHSSVGLFETDFQIEFEGANGEKQTRRFFQTELNQTFVVSDIPFVVTDFTFNPQRNIVALIDEQNLNNEEIRSNPLAFEVYPNPASHNLHIQSEFEVEELVVISVNGGIVLRQKNSKKINIQHLQPGVYLIEVTLDNGRKQVAKWVKQ